MPHSSEHGPREHGAAAKRMVPETGCTLVLVGAGGRDNPGIDAAKVGEADSTESRVNMLIDWIRVRRERRTKLIRAKQEDVEDYIIIQKPPNEKTMEVQDLPPHWKVGGVAYDVTTGSFMFQILSPEFEPMPEEAEAETEEDRATRHIIKTMRRAVRA